MDTDRGVRFFKGFELLAEVTDVEIVYTEKWHTYGQFEIRLPSMKPYAALGNRILFGRDERKNGIIVYLHTEDDGEVTLKGYSLLWMFTNRITVPPKGQSSSVYDALAEDIMVDLVLKNAAACEESRRCFPGLVTAASGRRGELIHYETRYDNLAEVLTELSELSGLGIAVRMDLERKQDIFEVREGTDRSVRQRENPPVIFRKSYGNILSVAYTVDDSRTKNCAYTVGAEKESGAEFFIVGDENAGEARRELYVDAKSVKNASELPDKGKAKLSGLTREENFEAEITASWYKKRWDLGDWVTVQDENTGIVLTHYVSEAEEDCDRRGYTVTPVFGIPERVLLEQTGGASGSSDQTTLGKKNYIHIQSVSAALWEITHDLNSYPTVVIIDQAGRSIMGEVAYLDENHMTITFSEAVSGKAYLI